MGRRDALKSRIQRLLVLALESDNDKESVRALFKARQLRRIAVAGIEDSGGAVCLEALDHTSAFSRMAGTAQSLRTRVLQERAAVPVALPAPAETCTGGAFAEDDTAPTAVEETTAPQTPRAIAGRTLYGYNVRTEWD